MQNPFKQLHDHYQAMMFRKKNGFDFRAGIRNFLMPFEAFSMAPVTQQGLVLILEHGAYVKLQ